VGSVPNVEELAGVLGCKVEQRLAGWKRMYLSKGARVTLIKSTLSNLPTYYLSLFPIPMGVANRMEKIQRDFLWGGVGKEFKYHLVNWDRVCEPIRCGGLGIRNLVLFNQALLGKWLWRYALEKEALWRRIVESKYGGMWGGWCTNPGQGPYGLSLWKYIRRIWPKFVDSTYFKVGNGAHLKFWHHQWCGETSLKGRFPELFRIASLPEASVKDLALFEGSNFSWNVSFTRSVQDWELESVAEFMDVIYSMLPSQEGVDSIYWKLSSQKVFSVNSFYKRLMAPVDKCYPWKSVWKPLAPSKVNFFIWTASLGKVLTIDNLRKHQLVLLDWCCMCKEAGESIDHLFLHCNIARELWNFVFTLLGLQWVMPRHVVELLACWSGCLCRVSPTALWGLIPHCLLWVIWRERNARSFEDTAHSTQEINSSSSLFYWNGLMHQDLYILLPFLS
jgi:hypothetical protein